MSLTLPADLEACLPSEGAFEWCRGPAVYALRLDRPRPVAPAWDRHFEGRPPWFPEFQTAEACVYVGSAMDALGRLTDHKDGDVRLTVLTRVCDVAGLHGVWFCPDADRAAVQREERRYARLLRRERPTWFVRQA